MANKNDIVTIICYGQKETMTRADAIKAYYRYMCGSEGAEHDRYWRIYQGLNSGLTEVSDGQPETVKRKLRKPSVAIIRKRDAAQKKCTALLSTLETLSEKINGLRREFEESIKDIVSERNRVAEEYRAACSVITDLVENYSS